MSLSSLPHAEKEITSVIAAYGEANVDAYLREDASEETIKRELHKARIIHFATHAIPDNDRPLYSRILLGKGKSSLDQDGFLEAWEIAQLNLMADMVVLSACESGRGKVANGEGVIGLTWAFMIAGVPTAVVSQWKADSMSASILMAEFHGIIASAGSRNGQVLSKAAALRSAALKLMQIPQYRHPFFWGSFVTFGRD